MNSGAPSDLIRTVDQRIADVTTKKDDSNKDRLKERLKSKSTKNNKGMPLTTAGYEPYYATKEKAPDGTIKVKIGHAAGPIMGSTQIAPAAFFNTDIQYDPEIINNWVPQLSLTVYDEERLTSLTAAEVQSKMNDNWIPHYFHNPMQDLDYITIEALMRFTIIGPIMDALNRFIVGTKFRPELELINPTDDPDKNKKQIDDNQEIITSLTQIDDQVNVDKNGYGDISFTDKISSLISVTNGFNRAALVFGYDTPITVNNKKYPSIPSSLKFAHARDLGIIEADPNTWRLKSVQWRNAYNMIQAKDMIYLWNPILSAKTRGSYLYGDSMIMPMIDASRTIRKNIGVNFPAMAEATWSGLWLMAIKPHGQTDAERDAEYTKVAQRMVRGGPNIILEDPNDVNAWNVDFNPKVVEFVTMTEFLVKYCIATTGMPQTLFYDEAAANMATMKGKINLAMTTVVDPIRAWIGRSIADQWYNRWFRMIYKDDKELLSTFRIKLAFSNLNIMDFMDKIEAVNAIDSRKKLTDDAYGKLADIPNYLSMVDPDAETQPGGNAKMGFDQLQVSKKTQMPTQPKPAQK